MCLLGGLWCFLFLPARAGHAPPQVLLRVFVQTSGEGMPSTQATTIAIPPNNETIMIRTLPEVTEAELTNVQVDASQYVHFQFNSHGQISLDAVTAQNQGRILVVMLDGYIIYAPTIDEEISNGELILPHPLPPEVVKLLQDTAKRNLAQYRKN